MTRDRGEDLRGSDRLHPPWTHHGRTNLLRLSDQLAAIARTLPGGRLLDYGARDSPYRSLFAQFAQVTTADLPGEGADIDLRIDGTLPLPDETFDCVLSTQVLEHVPDVPAYLHEARRVLKPDGVLVLSTHGVYPYHPDPRDLWRWTESGLRTVLGTAGFAVDRIEPVVVGPAASLSMTMQLMARLLPGFVRPLWHGLGQGLVSLLDRVVSRRRWDDAAVYVTVSTLRADAPV